MEKASKQYIEGYKMGIVKGLQMGKDMILEPTTKKTKVKYMDKYILSAMTTDWAQTFEKAKPGIDYDK